MSYRADVGSWAGLESQIYPVTGTVRTHLSIYQRMHVVMGATYRRLVSASLNNIFLFLLAFELRLFIFIL